MPRFSCGVCYREPTRRSGTLTCEQSALASETPPTANRLARRKARTRAAILEAAARLFQEQGFDETSIQQIAVLATTGVGTVYGYFAAKEEILREVLRVHADEAVELYRGAITPGMSALDRLLVALDSLVTYVRDNEAILKAALQTGIRGRLVDERSPQEWLFEAYRAMLQRGIERGELRAVPVDATVRALLTTYMTALLGIGLWRGYEHDPNTPDELREFTRALLAP